MKTKRQQDAMHARIRATGQRLANAAYNLSQRPNYPLSARDCESLRDGFRAWDEAITAWSEFQKQDRIERLAKKQVGTEGAPRDER